MAKNNSFKEIWDKLSKSKKVAMTLHSTPDGDSLGSCAAMKYVLERDFKCKVTLVSYDPLDEALMEISYSKEVQFGKDISDLHFENYDAVLFMDSGATMSGKLRESYVPNNKGFIINIDHHQVNRYVGNLNHIDSSKPSNCSLLTEMFDSLGIKFDKELSTRLMLGLCTDTGFFKYSANKVIATAAFLMEKGADYQYIVSKLRDSVPLKIKKYGSLLVNNMKISKINGKIVAYSYATKSDIKKLKLNISEVRGAIAKISDIKNIDIFFTIVDNGDHIKGSFRTPKDIDVCKLATYLGGGGHKNAAAFSLTGTDLKTAEKKVLSVLKKHL